MVELIAEKVARSVSDRFNGTGTRHHVGCLQPAPCMLSTVYCLLSTVYAFPNSFSSCSGFGGGVSRLTTISRPIEMMAAG